jgi:hypothetical protein
VRWDQIEFVVSVSRAMPIRHRQVAPPPRVGNAAAPEHELMLMRRSPLFFVRQKATENY